MQVLRASAHQVESHLSTFLSFVSTQLVIRTITEDLNEALSQDERNTLTLKLQGSGSFSYDVNLPSDERLRAAYLLLIRKYFVDSTSEGSTWQKMRSVFRSGNDEDFDEFKEQFFLPLYCYYDERIDDQDLLLYLLSKYKRLSEWFDRGTLFHLATSDTARAEFLLDEHLRRYLVIEGIDYPFSTPSSPKGRADIVVNVDEKPLPMEIKIFDDDNSKGKAYLRKGFNQALRYSNDYNQPIGYFIVFNLTEKLLQFGEETSTVFPKCEIQNKTVFIIVVDIHPVERTASQERKPDVVLISRDYLTATEETEKQL